jgi:thiol-disulfide isomerase/thioredoxin
MARKIQAVIMSMALAAFTSGVSAQLVDANGPGLSTAIRLGEPAPPFDVSYWVRGTADTAFAPGKVYVLEFFATWCHWCIQAMPHLSELNTRYGGRVRFIGVDVLEPAPFGEDAIEYNRQKVDSFVRTGTGKVMNYDVCRDTKDAYMAKTWVTGQGLYGLPGTGIPFTAIVDDGKVVWIGHPFLGGAFEKALEEIMDGTYDLKAFITACRASKDSIAVAEKAAAARAAAAVRVPALDEMNKAFADKDYAGAIKAAYAAMNKDPSLERATLMTRLKAFGGLLPAQAAQALSLVSLERAHMKKMRDTSGRFLKELAVLFGRQPGLDKACYAFAIGVLKDVAGEPVLQTRLLAGLAYAYYYEGDKDDALRTLRYLIDRYKALGLNPAEFEGVKAELSGTPGDTL